jgi:N-acetylglutamate synthase/N-acetylornithine aminotransferase
VTIGSIVLFKDGQPHDELAPGRGDYLKGSDLTDRRRPRIRRCLVDVWTCDLSAEYVRINADYRT